MLSRAAGNAGNNFPCPLLFRQAAVTVVRLAGQHLQGAGPALADAAGRRNRNPHSFQSAHAVHLPPATGTPRVPQDKTPCPCRHFLTPDRADPNLHSRPGPVQPRVPLDARSRGAARLPSPPAPVQARDAGGPTHPVPARRTPACFSPGGARRFDGPDKAR